MVTWLPSEAQGPGSYSARFAAEDSSVCGSNQTISELSIQVAPLLAVEAHFAASDPQLSFPALPGRTYRVAYCTDLTLVDWQLVQRIVVAQA